MDGVRAVAKPTIAVGLTQRVDPRVVLGALVVQLPSLELKAYLQEQVQIDQVSVESLSDADEAAAVAIAADDASER